MPKNKPNNKPNYRYNNPKHHYKKKTYGKSVFDDSPTLTINRYWIPKTYVDAVNDVITAYKSNIPFNRAVDQVATLNPQLNRNKLAEHTLKYIANEY